MNDLFQLNFDFDATGNRLMTRLDKGDFITFFEVNTPTRKNDFKSSVAFLKSMDVAARKVYTKCHINQLRRFCPISPFSI